MKRILFFLLLFIALFSDARAQTLLTGTGYGNMAGKGDGWGDAQPGFAFNGLTAMGNQVDYNTNDVNNLPWIALALPAPAQITKVRILPRQEYGVNGTDTTWSNWMYQYLEGAKFQAADDSLFTNPVDLATVGAVTNSYWQEFTVNNTAKYRYVRILNAKTFITFTQLQFMGIAGTPATGQGKTIYIPTEWKNAASNIAWDSTNRMKQSKNCVVFWGPLAGNDPANATNTALRFHPQRILDSMEAVYSFMMDSIKMIPDSGQWAQHKLIIVMNNTWRDGLFTGWAYGGGYDNKVPAMWVDPGVFAQNAWTATHEFAHAIQQMVPIMYPGHGYGNTNSGFFWETHANFMAMQRYPSFAGATDMPRAINLSSYFIGSGRKHYSQFYFLQQLKDDYGIDFVSRLWRETNTAAAETPLETAKRLSGMDQVAFNNYMMKYAIHSVKWDFSNKGYLQTVENSLEPMWKFRKTVILDSLSAGHFAIPDYQAPQQYGFNIVRLYPQQEEGCSQRYVYMKFRGHTDANANSGWRYGFVTVDSTTAASTFSECYTADSAELVYKIPANTAETYFVVMGAPTRMHFQAKNIFEAGFPKIYRYPWEIQLQGALPEGYNAGFRAADNAGTTGSRHANGGGWVASTASVAATAYVAPGAYVLNRARVLDNARIEGRAEVRDDALVSGNAVVKDFAVVAGNTRVSGKAVVSGAAHVYFCTISDSARVSEGAFLQNNTVSGGAAIYGNAFSTGASGLSGTIKIGGDAEIGGACTSGTYLQCYGITDGTNTRRECDGLTNSPLNTDVNATYTHFSDAAMSFSKIVTCGDSTGTATKAPVITLTSSVSVQLPASSIELTASATDADGTIASYSWRKVSGPERYHFSATDASSVTISDLTEGVYIFALTATDNSGMKATAQVSVTVLKANMLPIVTAGNNVTLTLPVDHVTLTATCNDPDGYIDSLKWYSVSGVAAYIVSPGSLTTTISNLKEGIYQFAIRVVDNNRAAGEDTIQVTVLPAAISGADGEQTTLKAMPSPTKGAVRLSFPIVTGGNIMVYDSKGSRVYTKALAAGDTSADIDLGFLNAGLYYINLVSRNRDKYITTVMVVH